MSNIIIFWYTAIKINCSETIQLPI